MKYYAKFPGETTDQAIQNTSRGYDCPQDVVRDTVKETGEYDFVVIDSEGNIIPEEKCST